MSGKGEIVLVVIVGCPVPCSPAGLARFFLPCGRVPVNTLAFLPADLEFEVLAGDDVFRTFLPLSRGGFDLEKALADDTTNEGKLRGVHLTPMSYTCFAVLYEPDVTGCCFVLGFKLV